MEMFSSACVTWAQCFTNTVQILVKKHALFLSFFLWGGGGIWCRPEVPKLFTMKGKKSNLIEGQK